MLFLQGQSYYGHDCRYAIRTITHQYWPPMLTSLGIIAEDGNILHRYCDAETAAASASRANNISARTYDVWWNCCLAVQLSFHLIISQFTEQQSLSQCHMFMVVRADWICWDRMAIKKQSLRNKNRNKRHIVHNLLNAPIHASQSKEEEQNSLICAKRMRLELKLMKEKQTLVLRRGQNFKCSSASKLNKKTIAG